MPYPFRDGPAEPRLLHLAPVVLLLAVAPAFAQAPTLAPADPSATPAPTALPESAPTASDAGADPAASPVQTDQGKAEKLEAGQGEADQETDRPEAEPAADTPPVSDCFDRELAVSRYHFPNPTRLSPTWQDIYLLALTDGVATASTRLTTGAQNQNPYDNTDPAWSPDGQRLVFFSSRGAGPNGSFYAMDPVDADFDAHGDNLHYLGQDAPNLGGAHWPSGRLFYFAAGDSLRQIYEASIDPVATAITNARPLTQGAADNSGPVVSGDGDWLVFASSRQPADQRVRSLQALNLANGTSTQLTSDTELADYPTFVPGTATVIYASDAASPGVDLDLYSATLAIDAGPALSDITRLTSTPDQSETAPRISPDGTCLAYLAPEPNASDWPYPDLWIRDLSSGEERRVSITSDIGSVAWRP